MNSFWKRANGNNDYVESLLLSEKRKDAIQHLKLSIKSCLTYYFTTSKTINNLTPLDSTNMTGVKLIQGLCDSIEGYLAHKIKQSQNVRGLWDVILLLPNSTSILQNVKIPLFSSSNNTPTIDWQNEFDYIHSLSEVQSDNGKARAFIYRALNESFIMPFLDYIATNNDILRTHYEEDAMLRNKEDSEIYRSLLVSLQPVKFDIDYNDSTLDQVTPKTSPLFEENNSQFEGHSSETVTETSISSLPNSANTTPLINGATVNSSGGSNDTDLSLSRSTSSTNLSLTSSNNSVSITSSSGGFVPPLLTSSDSMNDMVGEKKLIKKKKVIKSLTRTIDLADAQSFDANNIEPPPKDVVNEKVVKKVMIKRIVKTTKLTVSNNNLNNLTNSQESISTSLSSPPSSSLQQQQPSLQQSPTNSLSPSSSQSSSPSTSSFSNQNGEKVDNSNNNSRTTATLTETFIRLVGTAKANIENIVSGDKSTINDINNKVVLDQQPMEDQKEVEKEGQQQDDKEEPAVVAVIEKEEEKVVEQVVEPSIGIESVAQDVQQDKEIEKQGQDIEKEENNIVIEQVAQVPIIEPIVENAQEVLKVCNSVVEQEHEENDTTTVVSFIEKVQDKEEQVVEQEKEEENVEQEKEQEREQEEEQESLVSVEQAQNQDKEESVEIVIDQEQTITQTDSAVAATISITASEELSTLDTQEGETQEGTIQNTIDDQQEQEEQQQEEQENLIIQEDVKVDVEIDVVVEQNEEKEETMVDEAQEEIKVNQTSLDNKDETNVTNEPFAAESLEIDNESDTFIKKEQEQLEEEQQIQIEEPTTTTVIVDENILINQQEEVKEEEVQVQVQEQEQVQEEVQVQEQEQEQEQVQDQVEEYEPLPIYKSDYEKKLEFEKYIDSIPIQLSYNYNDDDKESSVNYNTSTTKTTTTTTTTTSTISISLSSEQQQQSTKSLKSSADEILDCIISTMERDIGIVDPKYDQQEDEDEEEEGEEEEKSIEDQDNSTTSSNNNNNNNQLNESNNSIMLNNSLNSSMDDFSLNSSTNSLTNSFSNITFTNSPSNFKTTPTSSPIKRKIITIITEPTTITKESIKMIYDNVPLLTLKDQDYKCKGCQKDLSSMFSTSRYCYFTGKYFCRGCHHKQDYYIPSKIINDLDFKRYPVSNVALDYLKSTTDDPLFDLSALNPTLYNYNNKILVRIRSLRKQMYHIKDFLMTCSTGVSVYNSFITVENDYLSHSFELYSLSDIVNVKPLLEQLRKVVAKWLDHIDKCQLCLGKGSICEFCNDSKPIFPFHVSKNTQCAQCRCVAHKACYNKHTCPKCLRIAKRKVQLRLSQQQTQQ
ncbi:hypothetical protein CYY_006239 [Polysphondylium violaceum]|uniref:RUN domain-containing protein n=1 Tax=Polysphondylium violaceum TaxID=133409 RepID=A0A8J4Q0J4_9MYCE|nr:hypothetical protein CYY_006239 [Polysphondylium violaceum]